MQESKADITFSHGLTASPVVRFMAQFATILALLVLFFPEGFILAPFIALLPVLVFTSKSGTAIQLKNDSIRPYITILGFKRGKWISTALFTDVAVLRLGRSRHILNFSGASIGKIDESVNEIYLLSKNHRKRLLIQVCKSKNEAELLAQELAQKMGKNYTVFNPQISEQTKARR